MTRLADEVDGVFLPTAEMVKILHAMQLRRFGGGSGIRDVGMLESAVGRGTSTLSWSETPDILETACAIGESIIRNHPFVDGNKRTGKAVIHSTLYANGYRIEMAPRILAQLIVDFAASRVSSEIFRQTIRDHAVLDPASEEVERLSREESAPESQGTPADPCP